ncbi:MAG: hypothetical protein WBG13_07095, partial [Pseudolabrys sp.]
REEGIAFTSEAPAEVASEPPPVLPKPTRPDDIAELAKPITEPKAAKPRKAGTVKGNAKSAQSKEPRSTGAKAKGSRAKGSKRKGKASQ